MTEKPASVETEAGFELIGKSQEEIVRLEAMTQANVQGVGGRIAFLVSSSLAVFPVILHVGSHSVNVGTLAERVVVTNAHNITLEVNILSRFLAISSFSIGVADTKHKLAASQGASPVKLRP